MSISYFDKTIRRCAERGMSTKQCAEMIEYSHAYVRNYVWQKGISFHGYRRSPSVIRSTCIKGYGKKSASRIAKELGITRSAVIGHWFRARKSGEIRA